MVVVITSHVGKLATLNGDVPSLKHGVSRRGVGLLGLLAVVVGHLRSGGYAFPASDDALLHRFGVMMTLRLEVET